MKGRTVVALSLGTAFVALLTMVFRIDLPATKGYFNLGDAAVFVWALLLGPVAGSFAGGVGSAMADVLGAPVYAPGTLLIKGIEGFIAGYMFKRMKGGEYRKLSLAIAVCLLVLGAATGLAVSALGSEVVIGIGNPLSQLSIVGQVGWGLWALLLVVFGIALLYVTVRKGKSAAATVSCAVAGLEMVAGYFLYEQLVLLPFGILPEILPVTELFPNLAQALLGTAIAVPAVDQILRSTR